MPRAEAAATASSASSLFSSEAFGGDDFGEGEAADLLELKERHSNVKDLSCHEGVTAVFELPPEF